MRMQMGVSAPILHYKSSNRASNAKLQGMSFN